MENEKENTKLSITPHEVSERKNTKRQRGANMVEYSLLVALIAVIAIVAVRTAGGQSSQTMSYNATMISKAMCEAWGGTSC